MGTTIFHNVHSAKQMKNQIRNELGSSLIDSGGAGSEFYCLVNSNGRKLIVLFLLKSDQGDWGYKDMDETMHPYYYNCPLRLLDKADKPINENSQKWREKVHEYHAQKKRRARFIKSIKVGDRVRLKNCNLSDVEIISLSPLVGTVNGIRYRLMPRHIEVNK